MSQSIRCKKLLYHLTSLENLSSILDSGLLSRHAILKKGYNAFSDVAEPAIISFREKNGLNKYIPFHFFCNNPFDGRVQIDNKEKDFIYICLQRSFASENNFLVLPMHPKAMSRLILHPYKEGFKMIDWELMDMRDYNDEKCRHTCMAEALSPRKISPKEFFKIYVANEDVEISVRNSCRDVLGSIPFHVGTNANMFK